MSKATTIAMWGPSESGKTSYIVCLYADMMLNNTGYIFEPINAAAMAFIDENLPKLRSGILPTPTDAAQGEIVYQFHLYPVSGKKRSNYVDFYIIDAAGDRITNALFAPEYLASITNCSGLITLIDPTLPPQNYVAMHKLLEHLTKNRPKNGKGLPKIFLSICLSKIDLNEYWRPYEMQHYSNAYVREKIMDDILRPQNSIYNQIEHYEQNQQATFIGLSSVGRYMERPNIVRHRDGDAIEKFDNNAWNPHNLRQPLFAILQYHYGKNKWW